MLNRVSNTSVSRNMSSSLSLRHLSSSEPWSGILISPDSRADLVTDLSLQQGLSCAPSSEHTQGWRLDEARTHLRRLNPPETPAQPGIQAFWRNWGQLVTNKEPWVAQLSPSQGPAVTRGSEQLPPALFAIFCTLRTRCSLSAKPGLAPGTGAVCSNPSQDQDSAQNSPLCSQI